MEWFVTFRLTKYEERRLKLIDISNDTLKKLNERKRFIEFYLEQSDWFSKTKKSEIVDTLLSKGFVNIDDLLSIRVYNLTKDEIQSLLDKINNEQEYLDELTKTTNKKLYLTDLQSCKSYFKGSDYAKS